MDAIVIGGGHAGLAVSHELARLGVDHHVLERGRVGESWRSQRWDTFTLNTPSWLNRLPGDEEGEAGAPSDGFMAGSALADRLTAYASRRNLPVLEGVAVTAVEQSANGDGFVVQTAGAETGQMRARTVVVASGSMNVPRVPAIASAMPLRLRQLAALEYRRPQSLPDGAVLVVGAGQSGGQIVEDLLLAGRRVYWSVSMVTRQPRRYRGRDSLAWLVDTGFMDADLEEVPDPAARDATIPLISGVGRYGHTLSLQWLAERGAILIGRIRGVDGEVVGLDDVVADCIRFGDRRSAEMCQGIDDYIREHGLPVPPLEPDEANESHPDPGSVRSPERLDLADAGIGSIVWATGVSGDFSYLPADALGRDGRPLHDHGVSPVEGLYHAGLPWMTNRSSANLHGPMRDAPMIAQRVAARA